MVSIIRDGEEQYTTTPKRVMRSDGAMFDSMYAAGRALGEVNAANIDKCLRGIRKTVKGFSFQLI